MKKNELLLYLDEELKYQLFNPIIATQDRTAPGTRIKNGLLHINGSKCPKCLNSFHNNFKDDIFVSGRNEQVAHIYGRKNFGNVEHNGNYFHVENEESLDKYNNYIYLCAGCHKTFDKAPTYLSYLEMLKLKKDLVDNADDRNKIYYFLDGVKDEINELFDNYNEEEAEVFSINDKQEIFGKLKYNNISEIKQKQIIEDIIKYYVHLDNYFIDAENNEILIRIRRMYNREKDNFSSKDSILNFILSSLIEEFKFEISDTIVNAIISYLIMKCEVLENDTSR